MDFIPIISNIVIYFFAALLLVLVLSYFFTKLFKRDEEVDNTLSIEEKRRHIRQYIINQNQYLSTRSVSNKKVNPHYYAAPTYSRSLSPRGTEELQNRSISRAPQRLTKSYGTNEMRSRYSIVNHSLNKSKDTVSLDPRTKSYSLIKEQRYYQY